MVHLCNIQMSAASTKHRLKGIDYDIDGFVSQLFASGRFVELVDKLSEEAANRIKYNYSENSFIVSSDIHEAQVYNEKGDKRRSKGKTYDIDGFISQVLASKNIHELFAKLTVNAASKIMRFNANSEFRTRTESSYENPPKTKQVNNTKMREELKGKVDIQAIINEMLSLSENLKHKFDDDESDTNTKVQSREDTTGSVKNDHISKKGGSSSNYNVTEITETNKRLLDDAKSQYGKADPNRYSESSHNGHNGTDGEDQENSKKKSLEEQGSIQEHINSHESQNSEAKGIVKQKTSHMDESIGEKKNLSSLDEENHNRQPSEKKTNRELAETKEETENRSTESIVVNVGNDDSVQHNKMVSDDNPYDEVINNKGSEDSGDRRSPEQSQGRSLEDQRRKEQSEEGQVKPIIRTEGGKQYTYVQHADYEEYNEKMATWRKTHPEKPMDFIM